MLAKLQSILTDHNVSFETLEHEPVVTSEEARAARGATAGAGLKCLLMNADNRLVLAVVPGEHKLDSKKLRRATDARDVRMALPERVAAVMKCEVGACYPLGNLVDLPTYFDAALQGYEKVVFNAGRKDVSIRMSIGDLIAVVQPHIYDITRS